MQKSEIAITANEQRLYKELAEMIEQSKQQAYSAVNSTMTLLFWRVGHRINQEILGNQRAEYGKRIVPTVSAQFEKAYGRNFTEKNVRRMLKFAEQFADFNVVVPLSNQLSWSHFVELFPLKSQEARLFYAQKSIETRQGIRELRKQISEKVFERTAIANLQLHTAASDIPKNTFKDPYLLNFLH